MKGLIIKDIYNIGCNAKSILLTLIILAFAFIPQKDMGPAAYVAIASIFSSMMVNTTFSFDDAADWNKYAMVFPITKKELVLSKYIVLFIFTLLGATVGFGIGFIGGLITSRITLTNFSYLQTMLEALLVGIGSGLVIGSTAIPLLFKYGSEQARILMVSSVAIPGIIVYVAYKISIIFDITLPGVVFNMLKLIAPLFVLVFIYVMFSVSYRVFIKKDL